ncbi:MAG TPA: hypothetical protein VFJ57_07330 [Solirubrobacterales bacterium]|nr:hypothetical protein [Solirubrobacterales bacterium]
MGEVGTSGAKFFTASQLAADAPLPLRRKSRATTTLNSPAEMRDHLEAVCV